MPRGAAYHPLVTPFIAADQRIATTRLELTPLQVGDADEMAAVLADPALYEVIGGSAPTTVQLRRRYEQMVVGHSPDGREQWLNWVVRLRGDDAGRAVGTVQATVMVDGVRAEIAWIIGTPWQGRGYAGEAAQALADWLRDSGIGWLTAHVHPRHLASQAVARRAGLTPIETFHDGEQLWSSGAPPEAAR
jgi:RimJ/RimL family protein N-acetyltransferase